MHEEMAKTGIINLRFKGRNPETNSVPRYVKNPLILAKANDDRGYSKVSLLNFNSYTNPSIKPEPNTTLSEFKILNAF